MTHPAYAAETGFGHLPLGRLPKRDDPRTLQLSHYLDLGALPPIPAEIDYTHNVLSYPMYGNDELGDCTTAAAGHMVQTWARSAHRRSHRPSLAAVEKMYWETGDPPLATGTPGGDTDTGRVEIDVLNYWRKTGLGVHTIAAYVQVDPTDAEMMRAAIYLFGGVYTGICLPITAQRQTVWDVVGDGHSGKSAPCSWGGHAVPYHAYTATDFTCVTWGALMHLTQGFNDAYTEEAYAILSPDWFSDTGQAPPGFDLDALTRSLAQL